MIKILFLCHGNICRSTMARVCPSGHGLTDQGIA